MSHQPSLIMNVKVLQMHALQPWLVNHLRLRALSATIISSQFIPCLIACNDSPALPVDANQILLVPMSNRRRARHCCLFLLRYGIRIS